MAAVVGEEVGGVSNAVFPVTYLQHYAEVATTLLEE